MSERKFTFWYKNEIKAPSLEKAIKLEKKQKPVLSSIEKSEPEIEERASCIGFEIRTESDDWE